MLMFFFLTSPAIKFIKDSAQNVLSWQHSINPVQVENVWAESIDPLPKWPHEKSDLQPDPAVVFGKLHNGFRYVLMKNKEPKDRVSMHLDIQAGSMHESDQQQGLAHFLEHMLFNGSTHFKPGELIKYFQKIGMQFGPDANAHTGFYETVYDVLLPTGSKESLSDGLLIMADYAEGALLLQSEIDRERRVVLAEKRDRDSASYRTFVSTLKFEFPDARISKRLPIGKERVILATDRQGLKSFYDTWYRPDNMILVLVGDFDAKTAALLIENRFSGLSARAPELQPPDIGEIHHVGEKLFYHFEKELGKTKVSIETMKKIDKRPDTLFFRRQSLLREIGDQIVQNRLNAMLGRPKTPFTSASIGSGTFMQQIEYAEISAQCSGEKWEKSLQLIEQTLRQALTYDFTVSELARVKMDFMAELDAAVKKAATRNSRALARKIISHLNNDRVFRSPEQERSLFVPMIKSLTLGEVHDAFKKRWDAGHRLILVTGNADLNDGNKAPETALKRALKESKNVKIFKPAEIKKVNFPYLPEPEDRGEVLSQKEIADLGILEITFKNGVRLNLKRTDFAANEVRLKAVFGPGRSSEPENQPGLSILSEAVINESGLGRLKKDEIERALAGKNTSISFSIGEDSFFFIGKAVSKEVLLLFRLLYAHIVDPGFREDAYRLIVERFRQRYLSLARSIDGSMRLHGNRFLAGEDGRFGLPPYDRFKSLTLDQIRSWVAPYLGNAPYEVSVVGDFDLKAVREIASKYLGSLPLRRNIQIVDRSKILTFPENRSFQISVSTQIPKSLVVIAYPSEDLWDIQRTRRLNLLADVVSERLRVKIRDTLGAAYSPFAFNRSSRAYPGYGVFYIYINVDPKKADMVVAETKNLILDLVSSGVTEEEMKRAVDPVLTSIKDMRRRNGYWLNTVLAGSRNHPEQYNWSRTILKDYASIKVNELDRIAKKYLNNKKAATIIVKPIAGSN
ncbi:MAG: M16 family metallopeptidase [Desulfobacterales bacterium]